MSVSSIENSLNTSYEQLSSMKKINSAADDAAGLTILEGMKSQSNGHDVAVNNAKDGQNLLNVAEGGLSSITESLQRIRELGVQASNDFMYTAQDKQAMQYEIEGLKQSIQDAAKGTEFNTIKLLDGSKADLNLATNPDGTGMEIQLTNSTLESLGIADFDVTKDFKISDIDKALEKVTSARTDIGATTNALNSSIRYSGIASENVTRASSKIEDLDVAKAVSELKKNKVLEDYKMFAQKAVLQQQSNMANILHV